MVNNSGKALHMQYRNTVEWEEGTYTFKKSQNSAVCESDDLKMHLGWVSLTSNINLIYLWK